MRVKARKLLAYGRERTMRDRERNLCDGHRFGALALSCHLKALKVKRGLCGIGLQPVLHATTVGRGSIHRSHNL